MKSFACSIILFEKRFLTKIFSDDFQKWNEDVHRKGKIQCILELIKNFLDAGDSIPSFNRRIPKSED